MSRYEPSPAPLNPKNLPEYVMRELRRVANVVADLDASLSAAASGGAPIGASYVTINAEASLSNERVLSASTGLVIRDRSTSNVVVMELDMPAMTAKSSSAVDLYYLAFDPSASAHVRVPGNALPGGATSSFPTDVTAGQTVVFNGSDWKATHVAIGELPPGVPSIYDDEFNYGTTLDTTGARGPGAKAWEAAPYYHWPAGSMTSGLTIQDGWLRMESSRTLVETRYCMDLGTRSTSFSITCRFYRSGGMQNYSNVSIGIGESSATTGMATAIYFEHKFTTARRFEVGKYTPSFSSLYISATQDTVQYDTFPVYVRFKFWPDAYRIQWAYSIPFWTTAVSRSLNLDFSLGRPRWLLLRNYCSSVGIAAATPLVGAWDFVRVRT